MEKKWRYLEADGEKSKALSETLGISEELSRLLVLRDITTFEQARIFFRPSQDQIHDPFIMKGMTAAVKRLESAIVKEEPIMIYGDYDVDGTSAVAAVYSHLKHYTPNLTPYVPDRYAEGYGVSVKGIEQAISQGIKLLITLDCGISDIETIAMAKSHEIDVIICDHHLPGPELPNAIILNPKQAGCEYPYKELSGCGVGFKLMQAFARDQGNGFEAVEDLLDLVALSIAADIVPLTGENRALCYMGLNQIRTKPRAALRTILDPANKLDNCKASDLVFTVAPRINAAGRMKQGIEAVHLLLTENNKEAAGMANAINQYNTDRKETELAITQEALEMLAADPKNADKHSTIVYQPHWHKGVIGIVASRLMEHHYRPTVILADSGDEIAGSVRSVKGFDVHAALVKCKGLLSQFGGHKYAAGLTISRANVEAFKDLFEEVVNNTIDPEFTIPEIQISGQLSFDNIIDGDTPIPKFFRVLEQFSPFGPGNMRPIFATNNVACSNARIVGKDHLQFTAQDPENHNLKLKCIAFGMGNMLSKLSEPVSIAYTVEKNEWMGNVSLQLQVKDIRIKPDE